MRRDAFRSSCGACIPVACTLEQKGPSTYERVVVNDSRVDTCEAVPTDEVTNRPFCCCLQVQKGRDKRQDQHYDELQMASFKLMVQSNNTIHTQTDIDDVFQKNVFCVFGTC
jgi:hypothetical protein